MVFNDIPKELVIIGGGAIGVEFAHMYNTFGSSVTLVEGLSRKESHDISQADR